jgi:hypothetical protein
MMSEIPGNSTRPRAIPPVPLQYGTDGGSLRRRIIRRSVTAALLVGLAIVCWRFGPHAWLFARQCYWQSQCMSFSPPPDMVIYERLPAGTTRPAIVAPYMDGASAEVVSLQFLGPRQLSKSLKTLRPANPPVEILRVPVCWVRFMQATQNPLSRSEAHLVIAFCHERISPAGHKRLVVIECPGEGGIGDLLADEMNAELYERVAWHGCPGLQVNQFLINYSGHPVEMPQRIFAGQCDPVDPSHFSIEYEWPTGLHGFIDGRLGDDDTVRLTVRPGSGYIASERQAEHDAAIKRWESQHKMQWR